MPLKSDRSIGGMNRRISALVATGFAVLIGLGALTSVFLITALDETILRSQKSHSSALELRAAVRSLRADYLEMGDALSRLMLDPTDREHAPAIKWHADAGAAQHLASAAAATQRADLAQVLAVLREHDRTVTDPLENELVLLAPTNPTRARELYLTQYVPARAHNMELVDTALRMASDEVSDATRAIDARAGTTISLAWLMLGVFLIAGTASGLVLSALVRVTARRFERAAADVARQRDHLQTVMTAMDDTLIVVDAGGVVTTVNDAACTLLGWTREELVGRALEDIVRVPAAAAAASRPVRVTEALDRAHCLYLTRNGSQIPMSVSAAPLRDLGGMVTGAVWVGHDMRDHLAMLQEVAAARDAALEGSRAKSEFLANMSHEIRTPMNVIIGYADMILDSPLDGAQRDELTRLRASAVALLTIIDDVLDIAKVEAGKLTVDCVRFAVRNVLTDVTTALAGRAQEKRLTLSAEVAADVPDDVVGDATRLRQVLLNLVSNAVKFTDRGAITVRLERRLNGSQPPELRFSVTDSGIGIAADKHHVVFEAFTQIDGSMSRRHGGTGLGLSIAARLVDLMGGRIWVDSTPGRGSTFYFTVQTDLGRRGLAA